MESPRNAGPTLKERMAALQSASKSAAPRRKSIEAVMAAKAAVTAMKPQVMAGFLKRSAGEGKLADVFFQRYVSCPPSPVVRRHRRRTSTPARRETRLSPPT